MNNESKEKLWNERINCKLNIFGGSSVIDKAEFIKISENIEYHHFQYYSKGSLQKFRDLTYFAVPYLPEDIICCADSSIFSTIVIKVDHKRIDTADDMAEVLNAVEKNMNEAGHGYYIKIDEQCLNFNDAYLLKQTIGRNREYTALVLIFTRAPEMSVMGGFKRLVSAK